VAIKKSNGRVYPAGFPLCKRGIEGDFAGQTFSKTRQFLRREVCVAQTFRFESEYSSSDPQTFIVKKEIPGVHFKGVQRICG